MRVVPSTDLVKTHFTHPYMRISMSQADKIESLRQWYLNYIDRFRKEYEKLSPNEKIGIGYRNNFLAPCQIEIFWITNPDYQLIVQSNCDDRQDKEIIINGPYQPHEFQSKAVALLAEKRWLRNFPSDAMISYEHADTMGKAMAMEIYRFVEIIKSYLFQHQRLDGHTLGAGVIGDVWADRYAGNIGDVDHVQEATSSIQDIKRDAKTKQEQKPPAQQPRPFTEDVYAGFGVHFFPPITMRKEGRPTIEQLVHNVLSTWTYNTKAFDMKIGGQQVIVNDDGLVFVETKHKEQALKLLNLIMACGTFYGHNFYAVREHELAMVDYDKQNLTLTNMAWNPETRRAPLLSNRFNPRSAGLARTAVEPETVREILSSTGNMLAHEELADDLRLFNDGLTHFENSEFAPAFVTGWSVIERYYYDLWKTLLLKKNVTGNRLKKLSDRWAFDIVLEFLNLKSEIDNNSYERLMDLKHKRNNFYHNAKRPISKDDAAHCLDYAKKLVYEKIKPYLIISSDLV